MAPFTPCELRLLAELSRAESYAWIAYEGRPARFQKDNLKYWGVVAVALVGGLLTFHPSWALSLF